MNVLPPIYLDECIDRRLADRLSADDIDAITVADAETIGNSDEAQLAFATSQGRLIVTQNQIDFRRLHAQFVRTGRSHAGIILVPQTTPLQRLDCRVRLLLDWVATFPEHQTRLFAWTDLQQRIIHGYRLPDWNEDQVRAAIGWQPRNG